MDTLIQVAASWILPALFFWFLFSLIAMIALEILQRLFNFRQRGLEEVLQKMMGDDLTETFYQHALANPLENARPSYISQSLFAKVILDWILPKPGDRTQRRKSNNRDSVYQSILTNLKPLITKNTEFGRALEGIIIQAYLQTEDLPTFLNAIQKDLESWFDAAMNQMTPVYGARLQRWTILICLAIAIAANFDVINITVRLWEASKYTEVVNLFEKTGQPYGEIDPDFITALPVGWFSANIPDTPIGWVIKFVGLFLGAFFLAIGSQYVFNLWTSQYRPSK